MKKFKLLLGITMAILVFFSSCSRDEDNIQLENKSEESLIAADMEKIYADYIQEHGHDGVIEHVSLEELNQAYIKNGLAPVTLEELGISEEKYLLAQKNINNSEIISSRCDNIPYEVLIDIDNNGVANINDIVEAEGQLLLRLPRTIYYNRFGYLSYFCRNEGPHVSTKDLVIGKQMLLGNLNICANCQ